MGEDIKSYTLRQLLSSVRRCISETYNGSYWIRAEASDVRLSGGHLYMELLEKGDRGDVVAKSRANLWRSRYLQIAQNFERAGLGAIKSGMSLLLLVRVNMDELYGLSLNIEDIDVSYSLGEIARFRQETIDRLRRDGIFEMNKEIPLPRPLQRIAIISSATAAGYGDFMKHIRDNRYGLVCYTALFVAKMQGNETAESVIEALERVLLHQELFDAVIIIRGGGAVSELRAFDSYELCSYCAQYPLPIISGIGHERDEVVLDLVANTSQKTPTAVADFIVHMLEEDYLQLFASQTKLEQMATNTIGNQVISLDLLSRQLLTIPLRSLLLFKSQHSQRENYLISSSQRLLHNEILHIDKVKHTLPYTLDRLIERQRLYLNQQVNYFPKLCRQTMEKFSSRLDSYKQAIKLSSPDTILSRGFAIVESNNKIITKADKLHTGDYLRLKLGKRVIETEVKSIT